jgi:tetratricopeptide (TPR) repeat protein
VQDTRSGLRDCWLAKAQLAAGAGNLPDAARAAERAVDLGKTVKGTDHVYDRFNLARAYRILGDVKRASGDGAGAAAAWNAGVSVIPSGAERPVEAQTHADLLERLGRSGEAQPKRRWLAAIGYRYPTFTIARP